MSSFPLGPWPHSFQEVNLFPSPLSAFCSGKSPGKPYFIQDPWLCKCVCSTAFESHSHICLCFVCSHHLTIQWSLCISRILKKAFQLFRWGIALYQEDRSSISLGFLFSLVWCIPCDMYLSLSNLCICVHLLYIMWLISMVIRIWGV